MPVVSLVKCSSYEKDPIREAIENSLSLAGIAVGDFNGLRVAVKPNLLTVADDNSGIITHPEFFRAAVRIVKENGGTPVLVESPAVHSLNRVIKKTGYSEVIREEGIITADPSDVRTIHFQGAHRFKHIDIARAYFDADMILCLPKFKTHGITYITGAVKLLFGAMAGMEKSKMHLRLPRHSDLADFLLDLYGAMTFGFDPQKPFVHVMDAIWALEGEGPGRGGRPRRLNAVLAGKDAVALDWAAARVAGLDTRKAPTVSRGFERRWWAKSPEDITIAGEPVENLRVSDFAPPTGGSLFVGSDRWPLNTPTFKNLFVERPVPRRDLCTGCLECLKICPAGAISPPENKKDIPVYDYAECIRCYCCIEICPEGAIAKKPGRLQWLLAATGG
ncbi:MAG: DUF362 domain-containing protein [Desulfobacterales bacterium]